MKQLAQEALDTAKVLGASYADIRIIRLRREDLCVVNGAVATLSQPDTLGFGVRVLRSGAWGFAASNRVNAASIKETAAKAVATAKASAMVKREDVRLVPEQARQDLWQTPCIIDPFVISLEEKLGLLFAIDEKLRADKRVVRAMSTMSFQREHQWLATTEGAFIEQILTRSGAGYSCTTSGDGDVQVRSYPLSFGGQYKTMGYELIHTLKLLENADRIRDEAVALLTAGQCPQKRTDLILAGSQLCLQIHESVGHPTELDRVLGVEADYAGISFATTEKLNNFQYGSEQVNLVADSTVPTGLATIGYDDDGVPAQRWHIVKNGRFTGYHTNREFASAIGEERSRGANRAFGYNHVPMIRITNLSLMPGSAGTLDDLIADTQDGVYMEVNKSWSIDQMRLNFQFGCEVAWEIKNGKRGRMLKNPNYQGITPQFWGSCDAICGPEEWDLYGVPNCGKGQPMQTAEMSHGSSPARFRSVQVGVYNQ